MRRSTTRLLLTVALLLSLGLVHTQQAQAASQRTVGFGFNLAGGAFGGYAWIDGFSGGLPPVFPYAEGFSPELRLHPADAFSIDLQWNLMWSLRFHVKR